MARIPFELTRIEHDEWISMYKDGTPVTEIAKKYNRTIHAVYAVLRRKMPKLEYYDKKIRNYENIERGRKAVRLAIIGRVKKLESLDGIQEEFGLGRYGVNYYLRKYLTSEQRAAYFKYIGLKRRGTIKKIIPYIDAVKQYGSIPAAAKKLGIKDNTLWVFLKRNEVIIKKITGRGYSDLLISKKNGKATKETS